MAGNTYTLAVTADIPIVTTAETAAITSPGVSTQFDGDVINIEGDVSVTTGASTTAVTVRVRRGNGVAGAIVGEAQPETLGAAVSATIPFQFPDQPGAVSGQQYTVTVAQTAASGNGTINSSSITITVGS